MTQFPAQPNALLSAPAAGQGAQPVTQPNTMGAPVQTQLDPAAASGPGMGGAATAQGVGAVMQQEQGMHEQPPAQQATGGADMAMASGQPVEGQPVPQAPPSWSPGAPNAFSPQGLLYNQGQGPVTQQVPDMMSVAASYNAEWARNTKASEVRGVDLELLRTGTSSRFRRRYAGKQGGVEHVQHTIAPSKLEDGMAAQTGDTLVSKIGHHSDFFSSSRLSSLVARKEAFAKLDSINVNGKIARDLGPEDSHLLNQDAAGPMKRSAVGESGLVMGVRPWSLQGEDAWPSSRPSGRSATPLGESKMAGLLGDMGANAMRAGAGPFHMAAGALGGLAAGATGLGMGAWNQTAGRLGAPKAPTGMAFDVAKDMGNQAIAGAKDFGRATGLTGLNNTSSQYKPIQRATHQNLEAVRNRPGVTQGVKDWSRFSEEVGDTSAMLATGNQAGKALSGAGKALAGGSAVPRVAGQAAQATGNLAQASTAAGSKGYLGGATADAALASPFINNGPNARPTHLRNILGQSMAAMPIAGAAASVVPKAVGTMLKEAPVGYGFYEGLKDYDVNQRNPGKLEEQYLQDSNDYVQRTLEMQQGVDKALAAQNPGAEPSQLGPKPPALGAQGGNLESAANGPISDVPKRVGEQLGKDPATVTPEDINKVGAENAQKFHKIQQVFGDNPVVQQLLGFVNSLSPAQQVLVGTAVLSAIAGIISGIAGKGGGAAMGLLGALGLGAGAYAMGQYGAQNPLAGSGAPEVPQTAPNASGDASGAPGGQILQPTPKFSPEQATQMIQDPAQRAQLMRMPADQAVSLMSQSAAGNAELTDQLTSAATNALAPTMLQWRYGFSPEEAQKFVAVAKQWYATQGQKAAGLASMGMKALKGLGRVTGWGASHANTSPVANMARRAVSTGAAGAAGNEGLKAMGVDTGVNSTDAAAMGAGIGAFGRGLTGKNPAMGSTGSNLKGLFSSQLGSPIASGANTAARAAQRASGAGMQLADRVAAKGLQRAGVGYAAGGAADVVHGQLAPDAPKSNFRGILGATGGLVGAAGAGIPGPAGKAVQIGTTAAGLQTAFTNPSWETAKEVASKEIGVAPEQVTPEQLKKFTGEKVKELTLMEKWFGEDSTIGGILEYFNSMPAAQKMMVVGSVAAGITGIIAAMAGKGNVTAIAALTALGLGTGAAFAGNKPAAPKPDAVQGATAAAEAAGTQTPRDLDQKATDLGVTPAANIQETAPERQAVPFPKAEGTVMFNGMEFNLGNPGRHSMSNRIDALLQDTPYHEKFLGLRGDQRRMIIERMSQAPNPQAASQILQQSLGQLYK